MVQLLDGRVGRYHLWHPPVMAWLMGLGDAVVRGPALFVAGQAALAFGSLALVVAARRRVSWAAVLLAVLIAASPLVLVYQAIAWKDVLYADALLAGFVALSLAARAKPGPAVAGVAAGFALLTLAAMTRQNGAVALPGGALALFLVLRRRGQPPGRAVAAALAALALAVALGWSAQGALVARRVDEVGSASQARAVELFDVVGGAKHDPRLASALGPGGAADMRVFLAAYTPQRIDTLLDLPQFDAATDPEGPAPAAWRDLILRHPGAYLAHRLDVFRWMAAAPDVRRCAPVATGVDGPAVALKALGMSPRATARDRALARYAGLFFRTPVYWHLIYAAAALVLAIVFLRSRDPADAALGAMLATALVFAAGFFVIGLACDYRYLYPLDLAAMAGALHWAAGLGGGRRRKG